MSLRCAFCGTVNVKRFLRVDVSVRGEADAAHALKPQWLLFCGTRCVYLRGFYEGLGHSFKERRA